MMEKKQSGNNGKRQQRDASKSDKNAITFTPFDVRKKVKHARSDARLSYSIFRTLLMSRLRQLGLTRVQRRVFKGLLGKLAMKGKNVRASDLRAGLRFTNLLISEIRDLAKANPKLKFFSVTCLMDEGVSTDRAPLVPLDSLFLKMYGAFKRKKKAGLEVEGWMFAEITAINNHPRRGRGRSVLTHGHALLWSEVHRTANDVAYYLRNSRTWSSALGAEPVEVVMIDPKDLGNPAWWVHYFMKAPHKVKNFAGVQRSEQGQWCQSRTARYVQGIPA